MTQALYIAALKRIAAEDVGGYFAKIAEEALGPRLRPLEDYLAECEADPEIAKSIAEAERDSGAAPDEQIPHVRDEQLVRIGVGNLSTTMSAAQWFALSRSTPAAELTSDQRYWLDRRADIIAALETRGMQIWSDKDRVWIHDIAGRSMPAAELTEKIRRLDHYGNPHYGFVLEADVLAVIASMQQPDSGRSE